MVLREQNNISSEIDGFACGEAWKRLKPVTNLTKLSTLKNIKQKKAETKD